MIKKSIYALILVILLSSCSSAVADPLPQTLEHTPSTTIQPYNSTQQPDSTPSPGLTDVFITQVMATKYASRTEYAAIPTQTPTPTIPNSSPDCRPSDLQFTFNSNGATGRIVLEVGVTNSGISACFLPAWPEVKLLDHSGKTIDITYDFVYFNANPSTLPPTQESNPGEPLVYGMKVNQTANLALMWGNWCEGPINGGVIIRMILLGTAGWVDIPTDIEGGGHCDDPTSPSTIDVIGFGY